MKYLNLFILLVLILFLTFSCTNERNSLKADLIIQHAKIWTANPQQPIAEAIAIGADTIIAVGTSEEIARYNSDKTEIIDAKGQFITPGFIDAHVHFIDAGFILSSVDLRTAKTPEEFIQRIKDFAQNLEKGEWITGGNWDHENWGGELPTRFWIDSVTPNNPVWISRLDGHSALANTAALNVARIENNIADIDGGTIARNKQKQLTGIMKDNAMFLVEKAIPQPNETMKMKALKAAMDFVAQQGVTSVGNMGSSKDDIKIFEMAHRQNELKTRIFSTIALRDWQFLKNKIEISGKGDAWFRIGALKAFIDGSLGSHTAAFMQPYTDKPDDNGLFVNQPDTLYNLIQKADKAGLQVIVHAIGDSANNVMLNIYEKVIKTNGWRDRRFRIEHAQHLAPKDILRFAELEIIPGMQPYHCIDDGRWAEKLIGAKRAKTTYAFRDLIDSGAKLAFGSDWYVAPPKPLMGIYGAVTRRTLDNKNPNGWIPEQKITVAEAMKAYTIDAAYASFEENIKGSLEAGKLADLTIIDSDLLTIAPEKIKDANVVMTIVGGKVVYQK